MRILGAAVTSSPPGRCILLFPAGAALLLNNNGSQCAEVAVSNVRTGRRSQKGQSRRVERPRSPAAALSSLAD